MKSKKYFIQNNATGEVWDFDTTEEVSVFLWGKNMTFYDVYVKVKFTSANITDMKNELKLVDGT